MRRAGPIEQGYDYFIVLDAHERAFNTAASYLQGILTMSQYSNSDVVASRVIRCFKGPVPRDRIDAAGRPLDENAPRGEGYLAIDARHLEAEQRRRDANSPDDGEREGSLGHAHIRLGPSTFELSFRARDSDPPSRIRDEGLRRCAALALAEGCDYFVLLTPEDRAGYDAVRANRSRAQEIGTFPVIETMRCFGGTLPEQPIDQWGRPAGDRPAEQRQALDARQVLAALGPQR